MLQLFRSDIVALGSGGSGALGGMFGKKIVSEAVVKSVRIFNVSFHADRVLTLPSYRSATDML